MNKRQQKPTSPRTKGKFYSYQQGSISCCSYATPEIVGYQRVNPFLEGQRNKAWERPGNEPQRTHASKKTASSNMRPALVKGTAAMALSGRCASARRSRVASGSRDESQ